MQQLTCGIYIVQLQAAAAYIRYYPWAERVFLVGLGFWAKHVELQSAAHSQVYA